MNENSPSGALRYLIGYYGVLQSCHLISLVRAGLFLLQGRGVPFPAPPPPGGWSEFALPFLLGMGLVDVFAIGLGLLFVYRLFVHQDLRITLGIISLTTAISSGVVYLVGTLPSGAWDANPWGYLIVLVLFGPIIPLYFSLLRKGSVK